MRDILKTEEYVTLPPSAKEDPFYRMTYIIKEEIRKFKWDEAERGHLMTWETACAKWFKNHETELDNFHQTIVRFNHAPKADFASC